MVNPDEALKEVDPKAVPGALQPGLYEEEPGPRAPLGSPSQNNAKNK